MAARPAKRVLGVDLSGPSNTGDTAAAWFEVTATGLSFAGVRLGLGDGELLDLLRSLGGQVAVGLDAPLSYHPGGGDRAADKELRAHVRDRGLPSGSVMTPTMSRMAYLTLRGIVVARAMERSVPGVRIVEVHPGAALVLRGASVADVRAMKIRPAARRRLVAWLGEQGVQGLPERIESDHELAACACALAAWQWDRGESAWISEASGALSPYDFAC